MKKLLTLITLLLAFIDTHAQVRGFGYIDTADLKLSSCEFEKDANAEVLFDRARVYFSMDGTLTLERHRRVKIFNEKGKEYGNVRVEYDNMYGVDHILNVEAQTINLENGKIVITKIDPKQFYFEHTDKNKDALILSFPDVKPGSVVEYRYTLMRNMVSNFPAWYFQSDIPTRYSEFDALFNERLRFKAFTWMNQPFSRDTLTDGGHLWVAENLPSLKEESYMRAAGDARQSVALLLTSVDDYNGKTIQLNDTWAKTGEILANEKDYFKQLDQRLSGEDTLIRNALALQSQDEKINYIFNAVKSTIGWNGFQNWGSKDGIKNAWKKRTGNSAEVNAIVYHLLRRSGVKAYPMLVSTRENGLLRPNFVDIFQINDLVTYVPVDSTHYYVLDATDKYNTYNQIPFDFLNSYGLYLDKDNNKYEMVYIETRAPAKEVIIVNADINPDATMKGTADITSSQYNRTASVELYKTQSDDKFKQYLAGDDNSIKISDLKLKNIGVDTLPLEQKFDFTYELNNSGNYIYFTPNIFTPLHNNPFLSEVRNSPIDFGYTDDHIIVGKYTIPSGYAIESLPKDANIVMADKSVRFRRLLEMQDRTISLHYEMDIKRSRFLKSEYPDLHAFFKKMYEMLNEQIVLKKL
ncbi:MAG TPA: DUF3857 domain-containing protein [Mucilaginibacter sp.]|nr:DUF3857 domain-containing protein [Mucilaginibacter sp.]